MYLLSVYPRSQTVVAKAYFLLASLILAPGMHLRSAAAQDAPPSQAADPSAEPSGPEGGDPTVKPEPASDPEPSSTPEPASPPPRRSATKQPKPFPLSAAPEPTSAPREPETAPYALPFLLRPVIARNVMGMDVAFALARSTTTIPVTWQIQKEIIPDLSAVLRWSVVHNVPVGGARFTSFANPLLGGLYSISLGPRWKLGLFAGSTIPLGVVDPGGLAEPAGMLARSSMDNALFDTQFVAPMLGAGVAYITPRITAQLEITFAQHIRVHGRREGDGARTNLTAGAHFAYFVIPELSLGAELRYQAWLVHGGVEIGGAPAARDHWTAGIGPRGNIRLGPRDAWLRPALTFSMSLDAPYGFGAGEQYKMVGIDLPVIF